MSVISDILFSSRRANRHPFEVMLVAFFYASVSLFIGLWIFPQYASILAVFLTVISCLYVAQGIIIREEKTEKNTNKESAVLRHHFRTLVFLLALFFGFLLANFFWMSVLSSSFSEPLFGVQQEAYENVRAITARSVAPDTFEIILKNNLRVLFLSLLISVFYGAGSVFILAWNASIMGYVIAALLKNVYGYSSLPRIFLKYFLHGIPEIFAYLAASLAGGILFVSIVKGDLKKDRAKRLLIDFIVLVVFSIAVIILAAFIETYISTAI